MINIAIFASGKGSNAQKIIHYFKHSEIAKVQLVVSNKMDAPVLGIAEAAGISTLVLNTKAFYQSEQLLVELRQFQIDWIVLAGFLWLVPDYLVKAFHRRMVNIHPALLPRYGGKGMYGKKVHQAIWVAKEPQTGMTIHYVNEQYDDGDIIFQAACALTQEDSPEDIARKVQQLEHQYFPEIIDLLLKVA
ncbi:MAG: phosphoribosylglycinamide formyltransferase [Saprospiraceae bacterium]|nr:phosphoribosylglycinamide formyltransferase [Saprospiraceae bacterium]